MWRKDEMRILYIILTIVIILLICTVAQTIAIIAMDDGDIRDATPADCFVVTPEPKEIVAAEAGMARDAAYIAEMELLAAVVAAEARGESLECQMAVTQCVLDRSAGWGMTISEVVMQPGQLAEPYTGKPPDLTYEAVYRVSGCGERIFEEPCYHFAEGWPYWADGKKFLGKIGGLNFWGQNI